MTKDLVDNRYSFVHRKKHAIYLKKFAFYDDALSELKAIQNDIIAFYKLDRIDEDPEEAKTSECRKVSTENLSLMRDEE